MEQNNEATIVTKEAFSAVDLVWAGTFAEAFSGGIRVVHTEMHNRFKEIRHVLNPDILLGLSYHNIEGGFTHYAVVVVDKVEEIPDGMISVNTPKLTYAKCEHKKGQNITASYNNLSKWIESMGYKECNGEVAHHEEYPMQQDPYSEDPEFIIMIPIETL